jgi:hypothetical protein
MLRTDDEERERLIRERKDLMAQSRAAAMEAMARRQTVRARVAASRCLLGAVAMRAVLTAAGAVQEVEEEAARQRAEQERLLKARWPAVGAGARRGHSGSARAQAREEEEARRLQAARKLAEVRSRCARSGRGVGCGLGRGRGRTLVRCITLAHRVQEVASAKENVKAALSAVAERKKEKVPAVPAVAAAAANAVDAGGGSGARECRDRAAAARARGGSWRAGRAALRRS